MKLRDKAGLRSLAVLMACVWSAAPLCSAPARGTTPAPSVSVDASARAASAPRRTLQDIRIEGEIAVPQVLFITARDQRRFLVSRHHAYLRNTRTLAAETPLPGRVTIAAAAAPETSPASVDPR